MTNTSTSNAKQSEGFELRELFDYSIALPNVDEDVDASSRLGTILGVYLPCVQSILGILGFLRLAWLVGEAGASEGFLMIFTCCLVSFITCIAMSTIATNGPVPAGGAYFMIKQCLGTQFGCTVGLLFYLGLSLGPSMTAIASTEMILVYLVGESALLVPYSEDHVSLDNEALLATNYRIYGTMILMALAVVVWLGVGIVSRFAIIALCCVILAYLSILVGIIVNAGGNTEFLVCVVGTRLVKYVGNENCTHNWLKNVMCNEDLTACDSYFERNLDKIGLTQAFPGISSKGFYDAIYNLYSREGYFVSWSYSPQEFYDISPVNNTFVSNHWVVSQSKTPMSFFVALGIFFPSCTGIMAGSNRSGVLKQPERSIPLGTISAILTTSCLYMLYALLYVSSIDRLVLLDKYGKSLAHQGGMLLAYISWPYKHSASTPSLTEIGALLASIGAGLQSLTGAPRLLQAIANDGTVPLLKPLAAMSLSGEPLRALVVTVLLAELGVLMADLDRIAPLLSMFALLFYGSLNLACTTMSLSANPDWRPTFAYYHWSISLVGVLLCVICMFVMDYTEALAAIGIFLVSSGVIKYFGTVSDWGEGVRGMALSLVTRILLHTSDNFQAKNWRPHMLLIIHLHKNLNISSSLEHSTLNTTNLEHLRYKVSDRDKQLFNLGAQLKQGAGLAIAGCVMHEKENLTARSLQHLRVLIEEEMKEQHLHGFAQVTRTRRDKGMNMKAALAGLIQLSGLGALQPNTIMINFPPQDKHEKSLEYVSFKQALQEAISYEMVIISPIGNVRQWDEINGTHAKGFIDMVLLDKLDTGFILMIADRMHNHPMWTKSSLRVLIPMPVEKKANQEEGWDCIYEWRDYLKKARIPATVKLLYCAQSTPTSLNEALKLHQQHSPTKLTFISMRNPDPNQAQDLWVTWLHQCRERVKGLNHCILIWNAGMSVMDVDVGI